MVNKIVSIMAYIMTIVLKVLKSILELIRKWISGSAQSDNLDPQGKYFKQKPTKSGGTDDEVVEDDAYLNEILRQQEEKIVTSSDTSTPTFVEMMKQNLKTSVTEIKGNMITIKMSELEDTVESLTSVVLEENDRMYVHSKDGIAAIESRAAVAGEKMSLSCNHLLQILSFDEIKNFKNYNNHIIVRTKRELSNTLIRPVVKKLDKVCWYSYDVDLSKYVYIETYVTQPIVAYVTIQGRVRPVCVAITINIPKEENIIVSGSLMTVNGYPFIGVYRVMKETALVCKVVAVAVMRHDYTIVVR